MCHKPQNNDSDRYGDGNIPKADYEPYQDNHFEPHPQTGGGNRTGKSPRK